jgi:hypothetical protein
LKNPACIVCPRKWVRRQAEATQVVREAVRSGIFISEGASQKPSKLWARDPHDPTIVYEAKLVSPPNGYKAYPLTSFQIEFNLPFQIYPAHTIIRNFFGSMTRKLSVTSSQ